MSVASPSLVAELLPSSIGGVPLHPLMVHLPVVFVPLAFVGAIIALAVKPWRSWCIPLTAVFAGIGLVGVQVAIMSGESLEELVGEDSRAIETHAQLAEQARPFVFVFFAFTVLAAVAWHMVRKEGETADGQRSAWAKALVPFLALGIVTGALSSVWVYRTGHSGAKSAWSDAGKEKGASGGEDEGGGEGDGD